MVLLQGNKSSKTGELNETVSCKALFTGLSLSCSQTSLTFVFLFFLQSTLDQVSFSLHFFHFDTESVVRLELASNATDVSTIRQNNEWYIKGGKAVADKVMYSFTYSKISFEIHVKVCTAFFDPSQKYRVSKGHTLARYRGVFKALWSYFSDELDSTTSTS